MLQVDLRELARGPVETKAELAGDDPLFEGVAVALADPLAVGGRVQPAGDGRFYWQGVPPPPGNAEGRPRAGGSALGHVRGVEREAPRLTEDLHGGTQATDIEAQEAAAPHALQGGAAGPPTLPTVRRLEAPAPCVPHLRLLQGRTAGGGRGRLT